MMPLCYHLPLEIIFQPIQHQFLIEFGREPLAQLNGKFRHALSIA
jgi:hypothetical protein